MDRSFTSLAAIVVSTTLVSAAAFAASPAPVVTASPKPAAELVQKSETALTCVVGTNQPWKLGSVMHKYNVQIGFTKSSGGASTLQAGQCAFGDRAVTAAEPSQICFAIDLESNTVSLHGTGTTLDATSTFSDGSKRGTLLQNVISSTPATVTMNVERDGTSCFKIVQITT